MKKQTKVWLLVATSLILCGCLLFTGVMTMLNWKFSKLSTVTYETNRYEMQEAFQNITINTQTAKVELVKGDVRLPTVTCYENQKMKHRVSVTNNTLEIQMENQKKWTDYIGIDFGKATITVILPREQYGSLTIKNTTGNILVGDQLQFEAVTIAQTTGNVEMKNNGVKSLTINLTTGKLTLTHLQCQGDLTLKSRTGTKILENVTCNNLTENGTTGKTTMVNVVAHGKLTAKHTTGNITLSQCDADSLTLKTTTGTIQGSLLSPKLFTAKTTTGKINLPQSTTGGVCQINTTTGNITFTIQ